MKKSIIEILRCYYGHDVQCVAVNDLRIAGGKCCGRWTTVRRWEVDESSLLRDLARAGVGPDALNANTTPVAGEN